MSDLFSDFFSAFSIEQNGLPPQIELGVVKEVDTANRLYRVELESLPGLLSDWTPAIAPYQGLDPQMLSEGSRVIVGVLGHTTRLVILGVLLNKNHPNQPLDTPDPQDDTVTNTYGDYVVSVVGNHTLTTGSGQTLESLNSSIKAKSPLEITLQSGGSECNLTPLGISLKTTLGGLYLSQNGAITFQGVSKGFSSKSGSIGNPDMVLSAEGTLTIKAPTVLVEADNFLWNGKRVSVVGDLDSRGDVNQ